MRKCRNWADNGWQGARAKQISSKKLKKAKGKAIRKTRDEGLYSVAKEKLSPGRARLRAFLQ